MAGHTERIMQIDHGGQNHDKVGRINMIYGHYSGGNDQDGIDLRGRYLQLQKKFQLLATDHTEMTRKFGKVSEERDKVQNKLEHANYVFAQHQQMQSYIQKLKYEKEQLEQQLRHLRAERGDRTDVDQKYRQFMDELKRLRGDLEHAVQDRDDLKYQVSELQRENERYSDKIKTLSPNVNASQRDMETFLKQKDELINTVSKLQKENEELKNNMEHVSKETSDINEVVMKLKEENTSLIIQLQQSKKTITELENEIVEYKDQSHRYVLSPAVTSGSGESLNRQSSEESLGNIRRQHRSMGRIGEDFPPLGKSHSNSNTELDEISKGSRQDKLLLSNKRKLSASTNNLSEDPDSRKDQIVQKLQSQLNRVYKDKEKLSQKCSTMRDARTEMEIKIKTLEEERDSLKDELGQSKMAAGTVKNEMEVFRGVTMQQTSQTYEKSMQLQTHLLELQTEKSLVEKQRDIALKEKDRMVTEAISLKKKLETIKAQRQKDAKELATMRKHKDKTEKENQEMMKQHQSGTESMKKIEAQYSIIIEELQPLLTNIPNHTNGDNDIATEIQKLLVQLKQQRSDYNAIVRLVYGSDKNTVTSSILLSRIEAIFQEKSELILEVEDLQKSASKLNEERIFDLKQTIETLYMEQDVVHGKNCSLLSRIGKLESERDKLRQECERLDRQCQEINSTLTAPGRVAGKNSAQHHWEETWEMKHVQVPLGSEGKAGFSVVGGRDQPQIPNPGSFIVTNVNKGGPAEGKLRIGDVLETVNGIDLKNADHSTAVQAVKESKGLLDIVLQRRKKAHALQVGIAGAILSLGEGKKMKKENNEFSLLLQKEGIGFTWEWEAHYTITGVTEGGPGYMILQEGDRIIKVNGTAIGKEKPNAVKKQLKPHKGVLRLVVEREVEQSNTHYLTSEAPPPSVQEILTPNKTNSDEQDSGSSSLTKPKIGGGGSSWGSEEASQNSFDQSNHIHNNITPQSYYSSQESHGSQQEPVKLIDQERLRSKADRFRKYSSDSEDPSNRPNSDGYMYRYDKKHFDSYSSDVGCTGYSETISESFLSEPSSFHDIDYSQTSIELTFHPYSQVSHKDLTVQSTLSTLPSINSEDDSYFARDDGTRTTFRTRSGSDGAVNDSSQYPEIDSKNNRKTEKRHSRKKLYSVNRGLRSGSMSQLSGPEYDQYVDPSSKKSRSRSKSMLAVRGKSRSNLSLTPARSMTSVIEEPRRSISITSVTSEHDPLGDATYIRANFSYVPRHPQEIGIKYGDIFHIIEDSPSARHRRSFWVSRLNNDGTDSDIGAIPNSLRAQEWLNEQGEASDISVYEEIEPFTGVRPVIVCGVLANRITELLTEGYPNMFYPCTNEFVEGTARITEARLSRERSEGKIIDFQRIRDSGYKVVSNISLSSRENKGKCVLISGSLMAVQALKKFAPPISILIKAGAEDSIRAFGYDYVSPGEIQQMYAEARMMDEQHGHEFTACLTLVFEDTVLNQITDIVKQEKHNQTWVPVKRVHTIS